ncbi:MAG: alpha/beta fold hydrolase [Planctomycetota bacterium]|nr:alpha/beta fold hydrolase [Planctomycetota bacterium]
MIDFILLFVLAAVASLIAGSAVVAWQALRPHRATTGWALANGFAVDPEGLGLPFDEVGSARMAVWRIRGLGDANAPSVVLLHGWGRSRIDSLRRIDPYIHRAHELFLIELPGHGTSATQTTLGANEVDLVAQWIIDTHLVRPILGGHSLGAVIAIRAAASLESRGYAVSSVIAWAPYESVGQPFAARLETQGIRIFGLVFIAEKLIRLLTGSETSTRVALAALRSPCIMIAGARDRIVPTSVVMSLQSDATRIVDVSHAELGTAQDPSAVDVADRAFSMQN